MAQIGAGRLSTTDQPPRKGVKSSNDSSTAEDDFQADMSAIRPAFRGSATSQETIRATPPINIPTPEPTPGDNEAEEESFMELYMRNRKPSVSFNDEVKLESGLKQSIDVPLEKPPKDWSRGRSLAMAMSEITRSTRSHSESEREHYDPLTGRHLPKYSSSPTREQPKLGEGRFPILQATVDDMARESSTDLPQNMSLTSESTVSPVDEVPTPHDDQAVLSSESPSQPFNRATTFSYDGPKTFRRTASQRWRDGEGQSAAQDFFSRAGSLAKGRTLSSGRLARPPSSHIDSTRSPRSAASSFLRGFSMSSSNSGGDDSNTGPPAVDAEGQTIGEDYVLGKQIGWGGFSIIKEVTQIHPTTHVQRKLAVKVVRRHIDNKSEPENDQAQAEFEHEVELWRFLDHPHILPLEAVYKLEEATFCFIPLNTGGTLFDVVRSNRQGLPTILAQSYAFQLASALRYLHLDARVVHRDIKLENCLLERSPNDPDGPGLLRVCDFGMAEWLSRDGEMNRGFGGGSDPPSPGVNEADRPPQKHIGPADTSTSAFTGGSLEYAAPEILKIANSLSASNFDVDLSMPSASVERAIVSPAVDIWAFGVCVYSLIVGSRPFQNSFQPRVVMAILAGDWDRDKVLEKGGEDGTELVTGCLDMDFEVRWDIQRVLNCRWLDGVTGIEDGGVGDGRGWKL